MGFKGVYSGVQGGYIVGFKGVYSGVQGGI